MTTHSPPPLAASADARELDRATDTTAHLSFAVYIKRKLCNAVLDDILDRSDRALAPSPGVDVGLVLLHARQSRGSTALRMVALTLTAATFYASPQVLSLAITAVLVVWLWVACLAHQLLGKTSIPFEHYSVGNALANGPMLVVMGVVGTVLVVMVVLRAMESRIDLTPAAGFVFALSVVGSLMRTYTAWRIITIPERRNPPSYGSARVEQLERVQHSEVITHRARERFTGFGIPVLQMSTKLRFTAPSGRTQPDRVELEELIKHIRAAIEGLCAASGSGSCQGRLEFSEPVFVADREVPGPVYELAKLKLKGRSFESVAQVRDDPGLAAQPMLRVQVVRRNGELVTNLFVKCVIEGDTLWLDFFGYCLPPTRSEFHQFPEGKARKTAILTWAVVTGSVDVPLAILQLPVSLARTVWHKSARAARPLTRRMSLTTGNCGPSISIRDLGTDLTQPHPEDEEESKRIAGIMAHQCMEACKVYLRDKVDITSLEDHIGRVATAFKIDSGGGDISIGVVGDDAQANIGAVGNESHGTTRVDTDPDAESAGEAPDPLDDGGKDL